MLKLSALQWTVFGLGLTAVAACKTSSDSSVANAGAELSAAMPPSTELVRSQPWIYDCSTLDYGMFWYGPGHVAQKAQSGHRSLFFSPDKPTVIYVHGWQNGQNATGLREGFKYINPDNDQVLFTAEAWVKAGWNVGLFQWNQFADEPDLIKAEAKIWQADAANGNSWMKCDGSSTTEGSPKGPMAKVFYDAYVDAMKGYTGNNVRLVGHSLGNQMASRLTGYLMDAADFGMIDDNLVPKRLALVDPYWSLGNDITKYPGAEVRSVVEKAKARGIGVEMYKDSDLLYLGSLVGKGDTNAPLTALIGETRQTLSFINDSNPVKLETNRHVAAPAMYFLGFGVPVPKGCDGDDCGPKARSAATRDEDIVALMNGAVIWTQTEGGNTFNMADDAFTKVDNK